MSQNASAPAQRILIPVSIGELVDKITILEIKLQRIAPEKRANVAHELAELSAVWQQSGLDKQAIAADWQALHAINEKLWGIEDGKRACEAQGRFDDAFIALARAVYLDNDQRAAIKRRINQTLGSEIVEEKSYGNYQKQA
jgi:hypothetical protein